jgi:predicted DNA-binding transcriptional regulator YafY
MYQPTTRVLAVLELLQSRGRLSGPELSERLEVDLRTVRRYVTMLQDLGIPVEGERGRYGGYRLRPGYKLPPLMFSDDEALAVTLGLLAARRLGLAATAPAVEGALAKVERVLPPALRGRVAAVQATLVTDLTPSRETPASATVLTLSEATHRSRRVWMRYGDARGEETEREFDPYGLAYVTGRWYAAGHCHLRDALRSFRLDRIREVKPRQATFVRPDDFDPLEFIQATLAQTPGLWPVEVVLRTNIEEARRRVPPTEAALEAVPDGVLLRSQVEDLDRTARLLVGIGCPFVVRQPPELRDELRRLAKKLVATAKRAA